MVPILAIILQKFLVVLCDKDASLPEKALFPAAECACAAALALAHLMPCLEAMHCGSGMCIVLSCSVKLTKFTVARANEAVMLN